MNKKLIIKLFDSHLDYQKGSLDYLSDELYTIQSYIEFKEFEITQLCQNLDAFFDSLPLEEATAPGVALANEQVSSPQKPADNKPDFNFMVKTVRQSNKTLQSFVVFYKYINSFIAVIEQGHNSSIIQESFAYFKSLTGAEGLDQLAAIDPELGEQFQKINTFLEREFEAIQSIEQDSQWDWLRLYLRNWIACICLNVFMKLKANLALLDEILVTHTENYFVYLEKEIDHKINCGKHRFTSMEIISLYNHLEFFIKESSQKYSHTLVRFSDDFKTKEELVVAFDLATTQIFKKYLSDTQDAIFG